MKHHLTLVRGALTVSPHCTGFCRGGRAPCICATGLVDCELVNEVAPDPDRVIQPPPRTPEDIAYIAKARRWALYAIGLGFAAMGGLLELFGAPPLPPHLIP